MPLFSRNVDSFKGHDGARLSFCILSYPYCYRLDFPDTSVITNYRTLKEAVKFATLEHQRRADLIIKKLKDG